MTSKEKKYYDEDEGEYVDEFEYFNDKYEDFACLLCYFHTNTDKKDTEVIKIYVNVPTFDSEMIKKTIDQAKEVLNLKPFPYEWIGQVTNSIPINISAANEEERYYKWVEWMIEALEEEAKRVGKL